MHPVGGVGQRGQHLLGRRPGPAGGRDLHRHRRLPRRRQLHRVDVGASAPSPSPPRRLRPSPSPSPRRPPPSSTATSRPCPTPSASAGPRRCRPAPWRSRPAGATTLCTVALSAGTGSCTISFTHPARRLGHQRRGRHLWRRRQLLGDQELGQLGQPGRHRGRHRHHGVGVARLGGLWGRERGGVHRGRGPPVLGVSDGDSHGGLGHTTLCTVTLPAATCTARAPPWPPRGPPTPSPPPTPRAPTSPPRRAPRASASPSPRRRPPRR